MSLKYINNNGEEIAIAEQGLPGKDGEGIHVGTVLAYNGLDIPDGYEKVEDPLAALRQEIYKAMWPIGRGFIDFTDTDYSNYLGFTWKRELVGMTPIGKDANDLDFATVGKKGGEKTHTLTVNEMPSHSHQTGIKDDQSFNATMIGIQGSTAQVLFNQYGTPTTSTGGSQPHNNLPPYQVVSYWKRVR